MGQKILQSNNFHQTLNDVITQYTPQKPFIVSGKMFDILNMDAFFKQIGLPYIRFDQFSSNPLYEEAKAGVDLFLKNGCDMLIAIGGGSAIDIGKAIKFFSSGDLTSNFNKQPYVNSLIPLIAVPTTAGTGSESTQYAVVYHSGEKQSISDRNILPDIAILDAELLESLPLYQKKCCLMDALSQAIEAWWSINSTEDSFQLSQKAICLISNYYKEYLYDNSLEAAIRILQASNYAGQAIQITQTTAPHAMSYKLTSLYGIPHGYSVALCLPKVWKYMCNHLDRCIDSRGTNHLKTVFLNIAQSLRCVTVDDAIEYLGLLNNELGLIPPERVELSDPSILVDSVNQTRLKNNPIMLDNLALEEIYKKVLNI